MSDWITALHEAAMQLEAQKTASERPKVSQTRNQLPNRLCADCGKVFAPGAQAHYRCDECFRKQRTNRRLETKEAGIYNVDWDRLKNHLRGCGNVICQRVENGVRCTRPVWAYHHILEAKDFPQFAYDWRNLVGVCRSHHPRPGEADQGIYIPTLYRAPMSFDPLPLPLVEPGREVPRDKQPLLWTRENRLAQLSGMA